MKKQINIFLVDDHELFINGLVKELEKNDDFVIIGTANDTLSAIEFVDKFNNNIHIAIIDINLKDNAKPFFLIEKIAKKYPKIKTIVLSTYEGKKLMRQLKELNVMAFVSKNDNIEKIIKTINEVNNGKQIFPKYDTEISDFVDFDNFELKIQISDRESEILKLISEGKNDKIIADELNISPKTVKTHRTNLREKVGAKSSAELVAKAIKMNLI